jgi:hypothetical protein
VSRAGRARNGPGLERVAAGLGARGRPALSQPRLQQAGCAQAARARQIERVSARGTAHGFTSNTYRLNREFLQTLSQNTGGFAVIDTNDPRPGVAQMFRENASCYVIGYQPSNERRAGRFRKIEVRVTRPDATVRTRRGYFESPQAHPSACGGHQVDRGAPAWVCPSNPMDAVPWDRIPKLVWQRMNCVPGMTAAGSKSSANLRDWHTKVETGWSRHR